MLGSSRGESKIPHRGAGFLFTVSSIWAAANGAAIESFNNVNVDTVRNAGSAVLLGGLAITSFLRWRKNVENTAKPFTYANQLPEDREMALVASSDIAGTASVNQREEEQLAQLLGATNSRTEISPARIVQGSAATPLPELLAKAADAAAAARAASAAIINQK